MQDIRGIFTGGGTERQNSYVRFHRHKFKVLILLGYLNHILLYLTTYKLIVLY